MNGSCFFNAPIWINPTTNTPILDRCAKFLFLALIAKDLDEFSPPGTIPEASIHLKPWYTRFYLVQTSSGPFYVRICHHFFYSLVFIHSAYTTRICSQSEFRILKIRESSMRALFCTIALRTSRAVLTRAWASRRVDLRERIGLIHFLHG